MLILGENENFSMQANISSLGPQSIAPLSGFLVRRRGGIVEYTTLLPSYFYGAGGAQLGSSWRQNFTQTGPQTILSRSGGQPEPSFSRVWREYKPQVQMPVQRAEITGYQWVKILIVGGLALGLYWMVKK